MGNLSPWLLSRNCLYRVSNLPLQLRPLVHSNKVSAPAFSAISWSHYLFKPVQELSNLYRSHSLAYFPGTLKSLLYNDYLYLII